MDLQFFSKHLISGCIPELAMVAIYFILLHLIGKKQTKGHIITSFVFCFYLLGLLTTTGICIRACFSPRVSYIPFVDMIRGPVDTVLNIILFIPMGFFLPLLYKNFDNIGKVVLAGFLISLFVEIVQLFGYGATDINDLITNTIGTCVGFGIFRLFCKVIPEAWIKQVRIDGNQCYYELLILWICSVLLMITIQPSICNALFPTGINSGEIQEWN